MTFKKDVSSLANEILRSKMPILQLRGCDEHSRPTSDLDILVPRGRQREAALLLSEAAAAKGWGVVGDRNIGYIVQLCLVRPGAVPAEDMSIKIDLWNGISWAAVGSDPLYTPLFENLTEEAETEAVAVATLLQKLLYAGYLRERDRTRVFASVDAERIAAFCQDHKLPLTLTDIERGSLSKSARWRLRAASAGISGIKIIPWGVKAIWASVILKSGFFSGGGDIIGVAGMDGSGKSSLVDRFCLNMKRSEYASPELVHLMPSVIPLPHQILRRQNTKENYTKPYAEPPVASKSSASIRIGYYLVAFSATRLWCIFKYLRGNTIVFDRSIIDFSSDLDRARIPHKKLPKWLIRALLPKGTFFYLNASPAVAVHRKGELTLERATLLSGRYQHTALIARTAKLDGDQDADAVFSEFMSVITKRRLMKLRSKVDVKG